MGTITNKSEGMDANEVAKFFAEEMKQNMLKKDDERNVFGSRLDDVKEINRLRDENLELKLIIGDMQLKIFRLENKLKEKD